MSFDELMEKYIEKFDDVFPVYGYPGDEEEMMEEMKKCLKTGKPYEVKYNPDYVY